MSTLVEYIKNYNKLITMRSQVLIYCTVSEKLYNCKIIMD